MEFFTATGKLKQFFLTTREVRSIISGCQKKKNYYSFPVTVKNSIKVGPSVFLL